MKCEILGTGAYSNVYRIGTRAYKPFDLVAPAIKTDQIIQFGAAFRALRNAQSPLGSDVFVETIRINGEEVEAISMPYTPGMTSLDKQLQWRHPTRTQLGMLAAFLERTIGELQRCNLIMLDFKVSNIVSDPNTGALNLCDWDSLATEDDATAIFNGLSPIPRGTYDPFCSEHAATYTKSALRYAMAFAAAITLCFAYCGRHPALARPLSASDLDKRHRAVAMLLTTGFGECPGWFSMPKTLAQQLEEQRFFDD